jgi:hypothetical protein
LCVYDDKMSGVFANLPVTSGGGGGGGSAYKGSAGLGSKEVRKAEGSDRPNYTRDLLQKADRRHDTDPAIRGNSGKKNNWM